MGLTFTDTFGPVLAKSAGLHKELGKATGQNAFLLQANVRDRIRKLQFQGNYKSLSARYLAWKIKNNKSSNILTATGDMAEFVTVSKLTPEKWEVIASAEYSLIVEMGSKKRNNPARPFFGPAKTDSIPQMNENWKEALRRTFEK